MVQFEAAQGTKVTAKYSQVVPTNFIKSSLKGYKECQPGA
jgi:hypothetical protein